MKNDVVDDKVNDRWKSEKHRLLIVLCETIIVMLFYMRICYVYNFNFKDSAFLLLKLCIGALWPAAMRYTPPYGLGRLEGFCPVQPVEVVVGWICFLVLLLGHFLYIKKGGCLLYLLSFVLLILWVGVTIMINFGPA